MANETGTAPCATPPSTTVIAIVSGWASQPETPSAMTSSVAWVTIVVVVFAYRRRTASATATSTTLRRVRETP